MSEVKARSYYKMEFELCNDLIDLARNLNWKIYPEVSNYDLVIVSTTEKYPFKIGDQIGIEAKLKPNVKVLSQIIEKMSDHKGPNWIATLTPYITEEFASVSKFLRISNIFAFDKANDPVSQQKNKLRSTFKHFSNINRKFYKVPLWVPDYEIDIEAGAASPKSVSPWKVKAVEFVININKNKNGLMTSQDFRDYGVGNYQTWLDRGWIKYSGMKDGKHKLWIFTKHPERPDLRWPEITKSIISSLSETNGQEDCNQA